MILLIDFVILLDDFIVLILLILTIDYLVPGRIHLFGTLADLLDLRDGWYPRHHTKRG